MAETKSIVMRYEVSGRSLKTHSTMCTVHGCLMAPLAALSACGSIAEYVRAQYVKIKLSSRYLYVDVTVSNMYIYK